MKKIFIKSTFIFSFVLTLLFSFCVNINAGNYTTNFFIKQEKGTHI